MDEVMINGIMSYEECCDYFKRKCLEWNSTHPHYSMKKYINSKGKSGLVSEFRNDPTFMKIICPFLKQYASGLERDTASSIVNEAISLFEGDVFSVEVDILVVAVLEACGYPNDASKILGIIIGGIVLFVVGSIVYSALKKK